VHRKRCLEVRDEASGTTGQACATRDGDWLEGEVLGARERFRARPGHFFGGIGLAVLGVGTAILGYLAALKIAGQSVGGRPLLALGFFCVLGGLQFLTTGVVAELVIRIYFEGTQARPYHAAPEPPSEPGAGWHTPGPSAG